jgi:hypothetical protein
VSWLARSILKFTLDGELLLLFLVQAPRQAAQTATTGAELLAKKSLLFMVCFF